MEIPKKVHKLKIRHISILILSLAALSLIAYSLICLVPADSLDLLKYFFPLLLSTTLFVIVVAAGFKRQALPVTDDFDETTAEEIWKYITKYDEDHQHPSELVL
ncbi:unnamed protein product [Cuscuta epithymum]|uniref:Uncharacterized protein n=1 Tax=Cuscuta epithymum TaxID=186058 RepID=A0AAV0EQ65_9ASTE|nr:unnamed protein product [Cuscuta epithymum]